MKSNLLAVGVSSITRCHVIRGLTLVVALGLASRAHAAFHLWGISQIYSNSSGTLQFIEMFTSSDFQDATNGTQIKVTDASNTQHTFTLTSNLLSSSTGGHSLLFATAGAHAAGAPTPDFIIPNGFLFTGGARIDFFGTSANTGLSYPALPMDGIHALTYNNGPIVINSPVNFAGQTGQVVPEPAAITLAAIGVLCGSCFLRRRRSLARMV